jgi:hypothetical protein
MEGGQVRAAVPALAAHLYRRVPRVEQRADARVGEERRDVGHAATIWARGGESASIEECEGGVRIHSLTGHGYNRNRLPGGGERSSYIADKPLLADRKIDGYPCSFAVARVLCASCVIYCIARPSQAHGPGLPFLTLESFPERG